MTIDECIPPMDFFAQDEAERYDMLVRALRVCPDLDDFDLIWIHLGKLGIPMTWASSRIDTALDEARAAS